MDRLGVPTFPLSCLTGDGFAELEEALSSSIKALLESSAGEGTLITRQVCVCVRGDLSLQRKEEGGVFL